MSTNAPKVGNVEVSWLMLVQKADPDWNKKKYWEVQYDYERPGRWFYNDPYSAGAYAGDFGNDFGNDFNNTPGT